MSYQIRDNCYPTVDAAMAASAASQVGSLVLIGGTTYTTNFIGASEGQITYQFINIADGTQLTIGVAFNPPPCGLLDTADGLLIGWAIAAAWLCTAGVLFLRKGMNV